MLELVWNGRKSKVKIAISELHKEQDKWGITNTEHHTLFIQARIISMGE